ncbi:DUF7669 domain-containing protein [Raineyella fluvialis]|uniref:DUF7669 domain-containing protein n=1 Tax=Raineyella fluvialis TaxID=2662261 RepID=UPI003BAE63C6
MLAEAVESLPEPFSRQDVLRWFATHHPETNPNSVSTHLQLATADTSIETRGAFARRTPLVTRVGRGEYIRYGGAGSESAARDRPIREGSAPSDRPIREKLHPPASTPMAPSLTETYDFARLFAVEGVGAH